jgi:lipopolysaccharide transport system ATP-binding protein
MYVRLAFSIAASMDPDLLFIDEVLALGDIEFQNKCFAHISSVANNKKKTTMIVSHNLEVIQKLCNKCLWLDKGSMRAFGNAKNVVVDYLNGIDNDHNKKITDRKDRRGNGKIKVVDVELLDENDSKVDYFLSGQNAVFAIHYAVNDPSVSEFEIAFSIDSEEIEKRIANNFSETINKKIRIKSEKGCIKLKISKLPFNIGKYYYNIWLLNNGEYFDVLTHAGYFKVMFGDYYKTGFLPPANHGVILLDFDIE